MTQEAIRIEPWDVHNKKLVDETHPSKWTNPIPIGRYNLVVIGAGTAGLVSAAGAAGIGAKVALIESHLMGGDCLNLGCVPSKALIRASRAVADVRDAGSYGVRVPSGVEVDFGAIMERMRRLRAQISPNDSVHRFKKLGVDVYLGRGRFRGPDSVEVDGQLLKFAKAVIATGARAAALPIPGLAESGYFTNETLFTLTALPKRFAVIGAGPIGCEMAQAFARFGSEVVLIENGDHILAREDADAARIVEARLRKDGVRIVASAKIHQVESSGQEKVIVYETNEKTERLPVDAILVGVGRAPNVEDLNLESAGVVYDRRSGVKVDDHLRTSNRHVYAAGDVCFPFKFTHTADAMARIVIQNALFMGRKRASALVIPWCTYTDPEIAHVGLYEEEARKRGHEVRTFTQELRDVDRALLDGEEEGFVRVHEEKGTGRILGATAVARHAGEMISELTLAMTGGLSLGSIAQTIHPYPTQAEAIKRTADAYNRTRLTDGVKKVFETWLRWRR